MSASARSVPAFRPGNRKLEVSRHYTPGSESVKVGPLTNRNTIAPQSAAFCALLIVHGNNLIRTLNRSEFPHEVNPSPFSPDGILAKRTTERKHSAGH